MRRNRQMSGNKAQGRRDKVWLKRDGQCVITVHPSWKFSWIFRLQTWIVYAAGFTVWFCGASMKID